MMSDFEVVSKTKVSRERISDLLATAFEGGSCYWVGAVSMVSKAVGCDSPYASEHGAFGGILKIHDDEAETTYLLSDVEIQRGLNRMAEDYTHHWIDFLNENDDATTGDVFLQCCVFGEVVYG